MTIARIAVCALVSAAVISCTAETSSGPGTGVAWQTELNAAKKLAAEDGANKLILVDFTTDWCGWCRKLEKDVFAREPFQKKAREGFVLLKINPEKSDPNRQLAEKYNVQGFPTLAFLRADGQLVRKVVGYKTLDDFLREMDEALKSARAATSTPGAATSDNAG